MGHLCSVSAGLWGGLRAGLCRLMLCLSQEALSLLSIGAPFRGCGISTDTEHDGERGLGAPNQALTVEAFWVQHPGKG